MRIAISLARFLPCFLSCVMIAWMLPGCDTLYMGAMEKMGYAKRDILSSRVKAARDAQEEAKQEMRALLTNSARSSTFQEEIWRPPTRS